LDSDSAQAVELSRNVTVAWLADSPAISYNLNWRVSRVIAGLVIARWLGGRKVRTPSS